MPSLKTSSAVRIARSLQPAERTMNAAAADVLTLGAEMFRARASGAFGALEGQDAVNKIGRATSMILDAMNEMADAHSSLREIAAGHQILSYGDLCPPPAADEPLATEKVQSIRVAA
jgi:hypothetical protein